MIGNDVVDLALAQKESNWERHGFLEKIFTEIERKWILESGESFEKVWVLWSMKESAYKIYNRATGVRAFNPLRLECKQIKNTNNIYSALVTVADMTFFANAVLYGDFINAIATDRLEDLDKVKPLKEGIQKLKLNGLPFILNKNELIPISISHHGRFEKAVCLS